jgi:hypothetical protein
MICRKWYTVTNVNSLINASFQRPCSNVLFLYPLPHLNNAFFCREAFIRIHTHCTY